MIRVGLLHSVSNQVWLGGANYFRNLLSALADLPERRIEPVMLADGDAPLALVAGLQGVAAACPPSLRRYSAAWIARKLTRRFARRDFLLERDLLAMNVRALFCAGHLGPGARIPVLAWIPDFQHVGLPQLFSPRERRARDRQFADICRFATRILLSSRGAQNDLSRFDGEAVARSRVVRFVAGVPDPATLDSRPSLERRYGFEGRYFFLPNQFWVHKNHRVVIEALAVLRARQEALTVLASGGQSDYRHPGHFAELAARVRSLGVEADFRFLGVIPHADLAALMWHSVAVLNPSHFEGWSTTVEEARSLGVPVLLSDIEVHREQQPPGGIYFDPDDAAGLADAMLRCRDAEDPALRRRMADEARRQLPARRAEFARNFEACMLECIDAMAR